MAADVEPILARANVHLPGGLRPGLEYWVDPDSIYVRDAIAAGHLTVTDPDLTTASHDGNVVDDHATGPRDTGPPVVEEVELV